MHAATIPKFHQLPLIFPRFYLKRDRCRLASVPRRSTVACCFAKWTAKCNSEDRLDELEGGEATTARWDESFRENNFSDASRERERMREKERESRSAIRFQKQRKELALRHVPRRVSIFHGASSTWQPKIARRFPLGWLSPRVPTPELRKLSAISVSCDPEGIPRHPLELQGSDKSSPYPLSSTHLTIIIQRFKETPLPSKRQCWYRVSKCVLRTFYSYGKFQQLVIHVPLLLPSI